MLYSEGNVGQCHIFITHDKKHTASVQCRFCDCKKDFSAAAAAIPSSVTTGRIVLIDFDNHFIVTENPRNMNDQNRFLITNSTTITNQFGLPIRLRDLQPGNMVRVTHANFQTPSVIPQTTAFHIQRL